MFQMYPFAVEMPHAIIERWSLYSFRSHASTSGTASKTSSSVSLPVYLLAR